MKQRNKLTSAPLSGFFITIAAAAAVMFLLIFLLSDDPGTTIWYFFVGPFANRYYLGNMLNSSIPLILAGLAVSFAFRTGMFNLGGEGQIYTGGLVATAVCLAIPSAPGPFGIVLSAGAAAAAGAAIAGMSGFFKMRWRTDELISSFLISKAIIYIVDNFITGPLDDPANNLLATPKVAEQFRFPVIFPPSSLDISIVFVVIIVVFSFYYLFRTHQGYEMRMCGLNPEFARYGGINIGKYIVLPMVWSGGLHGLAGAFSILGTHHMCIKGFSGGMGWNGIAVALIAKNNPAAVIPAALLFAYIEAGAKSAMINSDVTIEIASVVQSVVFFLITARVLYSIRIGRRRSL